MCSAMLGQGGGSGRCGVRGARGEKLLMDEALLRFWPG